MPVIKVWCLPADEPEDRHRNLHQAIVAAAIGVTELGLKSEKDLTVLFPADLMKYGLGEVIEVEIEMFEKPERTPEVKKRFATSVGRMIKLFYPNAVVGVGPVKTFDPEKDGFWSSE